MSNEELVRLIQCRENYTENMLALYDQNKGMIYGIARKYTAVESIEDLMQEAYIGLVKAVEGYRADGGALFYTYAVPTIDHHLKCWLDTVGRVIKVPPHKQAQIWRYNLITSTYIEKYNREPTVEEYAMESGFTVAHIKRLQAFMFYIRPRSLNENVGGDDESLHLEDTIASDQDDIAGLVDDLASKQIQGDLWGILQDMLTSVEYDVILKRYRDGMTLKTTASKLNLSLGKVRGIEDKVVRKISKCKVIRDMAADAGIIAPHVIDKKKISGYISRGKWDMLTPEDLEYARYVGWIA